MIVIIGLICGIAYGGFIAKRRKGRWPDILHYAAGYGIVFMLASLILTLLVHRNML